MIAHTLAPAAVRGVSSRVLATTIVGLLMGPLVHLAAPEAREVLLVVALAVGAAIDVRTRRVPNWLTAAAGTFALASAGSEVTALLGGLTALAAGVLLVLAARGAYGMGDVKAMGVAGAAVGIGSVPLFLCWMALAGGVCVAVLALRAHTLRDQTMAYAPAIVAGCAITLFVR